MSHINRPAMSSSLTMSIIMSSVFLGAVLTQEVTPVDTYATTATNATGISDSEYRLIIERLIQVFKNISQDPVTFYKTEETRFGYDCYFVLGNMMLKNYTSVHMNENEGKLLFKHRCCACFLVFCERPRTEEERALYVEWMGLRQKRKYRKALETLKEVSGLGVVFVPGVAGNLLLLIVIFHHMGKEIPTTNYFIASMAISDFMTSLFCCPLQALEVLTNGRPWLCTTKFLVFLCKFLPFVFYLSINCSILMMLGMGIERYLVTCHPLKALAWITKKRVLCSISLTWLVAVAFASPILYLRTAELGDYCMISQSHLTELVTFYGVNLLAVYAVPVFILVVLYAKITRRLTKSIEELNSLQQRTNARGRGQSQDDPSGRIQLIRTLIAMMVIFVLSWAPYLILTFVHPIETRRTYYQDEAFTWNYPVCEIMDTLLYTDVKRRGNEHRMLAAVASLSFLSPALNPIIMPIMSRRFRAGYAKAFRCCWIPINKNRKSSENATEDPPTMDLTSVASTRL